MNKLIIDSHDAFAAFQGKLLGTSDYLQISQERINQFAEATIDHQWIHTDPERAATEGSFKKTIAHGYLTLSLVPYLWDQIVEVKNLKMMINYGIEKLRFAQPVTVDSEVRLTATAQSITKLRDVTKAQLDVALEIKDNPKPAFTATLVFLYYFE
ncbi:MAG: MaoC family dehydratase [Cyclobacteriaceae bacterium]